MILVYTTCGMPLWDAESRQVMHTAETVMIV